MRIAVCIKQVPGRDWRPRLNDAKSWISDDTARHGGRLGFNGVLFDNVSYEMNEPDAYALEEGLRRFVEWFRSYYKL